MNFLAIDDEPLCLDDLRFALEDAAPGCTCACFFQPLTRFGTGPD